MATAMLDDLFRPPALDDFPGPFARRARQVAAELRGRWERTIRAAAEARKLPELHATRDDYRMLLEGHLRLIEQYQALSALHGQVFGSNPEWADDLAAAAGGLRGLYDQLFPRWQTLDDLYRIVGDAVAIPPEKWPALAAKFRPPDWWYDEDVDPFGGK